MPHKRRTRSRWSIDGGGVALGVLAVVFLGMGLSDAVEYWTLSSLINRGAEADVRITGMERKPGRSSIDIIAYEFTPAGDTETITGEDRFSLSGPNHSVPTSEYLKLHSNNLRVRYLPSNPAVNRLEIGLGHRKSRRVLWGLVWLANAVVLAVLAIRRCRQ